MRRPTCVALAGLTTAGLALAGCATTGTQIAGPIGIEAVSFAARLAPADSCDSLLTQLRGQAEARVGPYGLDGGPLYYGSTAAKTTVVGATAAPVPAGAPAARDATAESSSATGSSADEFSTTNVQEVGIDEPDIVKTDGKRIFAVANGVFYVVDLTGATPRVAGTVKLSDANYMASEVLVSGDRAIVFGTAATYAVDVMPPRGIAAPADTPVRPFTGQNATITQLDLSDGAHPSVTRQLDVDGTYLTARQVGAMVRVVVRSYPSQLPFVSPQSQSGEARAKEFNQQVARESTLQDWLPSYTLADGSGTPIAKGLLTECTRVDVPSRFAGFGSLSVLTFDMTKTLGNGDAVSVMADGQTVYASDKNLYVATTSYVEPADRVKPIADYGTSIHAFDISGTAPAKYTASGEVPGHLLNQFAMSEYNGFLRAATTNGAPWAAGTDSSITVLQRKDDRLEPVGQVGGMGKGERIYSVRYAGPSAYVVTFRQTDPFYTVDLSDPAAPKVVGELKIPGYSGYLHPIGANYVLGVGQDASTTGRVSGTKVTLFDVSNLADPKEVSTWKLPASNSQAEFDHHAFLYWDDKKIAVLPIMSYGGIAPGGIAPGGIAPGGIAPGGTAAVVLSIDPAKGITEVGRITHAATAGNPVGQIVRSLVAADRIWTMSYLRLQANTFTDLSVTASIPLQ